MNQVSNNAKATFLVDASTGKILGASDEALRLYGYPHRDFVNSFIHDYFLDGIRPDLETESKQSGRERFSISETIRTGSGNDIRVEMIFSRLSFNTGSIFFTTVIPQENSLLQENGSQTPATKHPELMRETNSLEWQIWLDAFGQILFVSPVCQSITGYGPEELKHNNALLEQLLSWPDFAREAKHTSSGEVRTIQSFHKSGRPLWFEVRVQTNQKPSTSGMTVGVSILDVTDRKIHLERFALFNEITDQSLDGIFLMDEKMNILSVNHTFTRMTGYSYEEATRQDIWILYSGRDQSDNSIRRIGKSVRENGKWMGKLWLKRKSGQIYQEWMYLTSFKNHSGNVLNYIGIISDPDLRTRWETRFRFMEKYDRHTLLPGRDSFLEALNHQIARHKKDPANLPEIVLIDLENFRLMNNSLGFEHGDRLLLAISERLVTATPTGTITARLGGDEFGLILHHCKDEESRADFLQELNRTLEKPYFLDQETIIQKSKVFHLQYDPSFENALEFLQKAEEGLFYSKTNRYDPYQGPVPESDIALEDQIKTAIRENQFELYYQPQFNLCSGELTGFESLIRWNHPQRGFLLPGSFIPYSEKIGLIEPIGDWVLEEVARTIRLWMDQGKNPPPIAVNFSALQLYSENFSENLVSSVLRHGVDPRQIEIEITESAALRDLDYSVRTLRQLNKFGFSIAIDDFGTGYSSLLYLKKLPCQNIKIDRIFIEDLDYSAESKRFLNGIIGLARGLDLKITMEGIETESQHSYLKDLECHTGQGFFLGMPMSKSDAEKLF